MIIGIAGPFNCSYVKEFFEENTNLPNINITATSVNIYIKTLLNLGHEVVVFTVDPYAKKDYMFVGKKIKIYIIARKFSIKGFCRYRIHKKIKKYIEKELNNVDVLHAQWTYEYALAVSSFVNKKPVFCTIRDWCPYILSIVKGLRNKYYLLMSCFIFNRVMKEKKIYFIANFRYTYNCIKEKYPKYIPCIIPNPVQSKQILNERKEYPKDQVFISISQYLCNTRKNYKTLLQAFNKYLKYKPNVKLILMLN